MVIGHWWYTIGGINCLTQRREGAKGRRIRALHQRSLIEPSKHLLILASSL
jgi:hypothetical protein